jgi:Xaa-Pro aminopeptidase/Xaa-Pro dipeptidase
MRPEAFIIQARVAKARVRMEQHACTALLFFDRSNIRYLCGFTGSEGALVLGMDTATLLVDGRYVTQAREEAPSVQVVEYQDRIEGLVAALSAFPSVSAGFDPALMDVKTFLGLRDRGGDRSLCPLPSGALDIRAIKDQEEIDLLRKAAQISAGALEILLRKIKPGASEKYIADELEHTLRMQGAEAVSFPVIVASGHRTAMPHAAPGLRHIQQGDVVIVDYGAVYEGYHADETCTFVVGQASDEILGMYRLVKEAHDRALDAVKSGASCREVDRAARHCIEEGGMGKYFSHGTGHGVGLDVHEPPRLSYNSNDVLEAGMVITIEPGVYVPDVGGVRIEDMVLVTDCQYEVLTVVPKSMQVLN